MAPKAPERVSTAGQTAPIDDTDARIVQALRTDGRMSVRALAEHLHISRASAYTRIARLERSGVITGYTATVDPQRCGYGVSAYVHLKISQHSWKTVRQRLSALADIEHGALVTGDNDIVLLIRVHDAAGLRDLVLNRLQAMPEVLTTQTVLIFDELHSVLPTDADELADASRRQ